MKKRLNIPGLSLVSLAWLVLLLAFVFRPSAARAGGGPTGVIVIYDPNDPRSVTIANHYQNVRGIPDNNLVPYPFPTNFDRTTAWDMVYSLRQTLADRGLNPQVQSLALAGITPLDSAQVATNTDRVSIQSFLLAAPGYGEASFPHYSTQLNGLYAGDSPFSGDAPAGTRALTASTVADGRTYWPVSSIGFPGKYGSSPREILAFLTRVKQNDGAKPVGGTIYWPLNSDSRSTTRQSEISTVTPVWNARGIPYQILGNPANTSLFWVSDRYDIQGGIVGAQEFSNLNNTFLPGAWVDNLTSFGGRLDQFYGPGQTTAGAWLRAGADGSSGTISEPFAISGKFPHANIHTHIRAGASMVEAFWQSIKQANEIICLADPLSQPFADFPVVTVSSPTEGAQVSGMLSILASASATGNKTLEPALDLFVDGRRVAIGSASETVQATRTAGGFTLNTATLSDGWHELRVVAYNNDAIRTQTETAVTVQVNNLGQSLTLTAPASINPDGSANFSVTPQGLTDLTSLILQANGRTLATLPVAGGTVNVSGSLAPLDGNWNVYAIGIRGNGQKISSAPAAVPVLWPASAASTASYGTAMADVRYFSNTVASGFDWNTSTPSVVTTFAGDAFGQLIVTPTGIPGIAAPTDYSTRPGYEMTFRFNAPVDDWYEFGFDNGALRQCTVDGVDLTDRNMVFGPRRLAAGWHTVRIRIAFTSSWTSWIVRVRGGNSQDFVYLYSSMCSNAGTGVPADAPTITSITSSAPIPVPWYWTSLTANATIGGGTPGELAGLSYQWSLLNGPRPVSFNINNSNAAKTAQAYFTAPGTYVIGLRVTGPNGSSFSSLNLPVVQTATGFVLTTNSVTSAVRGNVIPLLAYTQDQFGRRINITPTVPGQPTITWTTTDPAGTITTTDASGESAKYVSLSGVSASQSFTVTATGTNGRTGNATSASLTITPRSAMTSPSVRLFTVSQSTDRRIQFQSTVAGNNETSGVLTYAWSVLSVPAGSSLVLNGTRTAAISGVATGTGVYTVRLSVTDLVGNMLTEDQSFSVAADQSASALPNFTKITSSVSSTVGLTASFFISGSSTFNTPTTGIQWQTSSDSGATWVDVAGATSMTWVTGPLVETDNGKLVRVRVSSAFGETISNISTLSVGTPSQPLIAIIGAPQGRIVDEGAGTVDVVIRRYGPTTAASVNYSILDIGYATQGVDYLGVGGSSTYSGTLSWADGDSSDRVLSIPIVNDTEAEYAEYFYVYLSSPTGATVANSSVYFLITITDNDSPGTAAFASATTSVREGAGNAVLSVQRSAGAGPLTVGYSTASGNAQAGVDFTSSSGNLTWAAGDFAPKQINVPILSDSLIEGNETFTVKLTGDPSLLGVLSTATVTIQDAPYQQWQSQWWPTLVPKVTSYPDYLTANRALLPLWTFRFSESTGTSVAGVNASGTTVATGTLAVQGAGGSYALQGVGPRPPSWPGLEANNTAVNLTAVGASGSTTPPYFDSGGFITAGTANGVGSKLGGGFTISGFVKTTVTDKAMFMMGGVTNGTVLWVILNQAYGKPFSVTPQSLRIYLATAGKSAEFSAPLSGLPSGSLCDGQWHHIAVTLPAFTANSYAYGTDLARFFFDGEEVSPLLVRGLENIGSGLVFNDFTTVGLRIGAGYSTYADSFFSGSLDEVSFFSRVVSPQEIRELATAQPAPALPAALAETANPSGDGVPNLMKYALGLNPLVPVAAGGLPSVAIAGNDLDFSFTRLRDATDITYRVERSLDLSQGSWLEVWNSSGDPYGSGNSAITESLVFDLQGMNKAFFRLKISKP